MQNLGRVSADLMDVMLQEGQTMSLNPAPDPKPFKPICLSKKIYKCSLLQFQMFSIYTRVARSGTKTNPEPAEVTK